MSDTKTCLIKQPAGMGDIFFCQKIAKTIQKETDYKRVIWPVAPVYSYLKDYMIGDDIDFVNQEDDFPFKDVYHSGNLNIIRNEKVLFVPLQTADTLLGACKCHGNNIAHGHMKYNFVNMSYDNWSSFFDFKRDRNREYDLIDKLGLDLTEPFNLVNKICGTYPHVLIRDIEPNNGYRNIYMDIHEGTTLFDWLTVIECAEEIHTMETSLWYILEKMNFENVYIYSKHHYKVDDFSYMKDQCSPVWHLVN